MQQAAFAYASFHETRMTALKSPSPNTSPPRPRSRPGTRPRRSGRIFRQFSQRAIQFSAERKSPSPEVRPSASPRRPLTSSASSGSLGRRSVRLVAARSGRFLITKSNSMGRQPRKFAAVPMYFLRDTHADDIELSCAQRASRPFRRSNTARSSRLAARYRWLDLFKRSRTCGSAP